MESVEVNSLHVIWLLFAAALAALWAFRFGAIGWASRHRAILGNGSHPEPLVDAPKLSVVLAARDEEVNIEPCLRTLLDQDYADYEVVAVNDRSVDRTPEIMQELEAEVGGRLRVVTICEAREGWAGKNNAMREGVAASRGDWLLFVDADCYQTSRRTLSVAMAEARKKNLDFLTIIPTLDTPTVWERIIQPICSWLLILWFLPDRVNDPNRKTAYANGQFILMSRACYVAIGGHERVRHELNEDIMLAKLAKRSGFSIRVTENQDLYRSRMYPTFGGAWRGWSRIFYGSLVTVRRIWISLVMVGLYSLFPWFATTVSAVAWALSADPSRSWWRYATGAWVIVLILQLASAWRYHGIVRTGRVWALTHPLGSAIVFGMLCSSLLKVLGLSNTNWRGTVYHKSRVGSPSKPMPPSTTVDRAHDARNALEPSAASSAAP